MIDKFRKRKKIKHFKKVAKINKMLPKSREINNFRNISLSQKTIQYPYFKSSIASMAQRTIKLKWIWNEFVRKWSHLNNDYHSINSETMQ